ncbi:hypothetical protein L9F63_005452, partial [Diploptera punctata]
MFTILKRPASCSNNPNTTSARQNVNAYIQRRLQNVYGNQVEDRSISLFGTTGEGSERVILVDTLPAVRILLLLILEKPS